MEMVYLVRYGLMGHVGRFASELPGLERGQSVVIRSARGVELGELLTVTRSAGQSEPPAPLLRPASDDDRERARRAALDRPRRLDACEAVFRDGTWPLDLLDAEPLPDLDGQTARVVVHYLGPHRLDTAGLAAALRDALGLDIVFEPVGRDIPEPEPAGCGAEGCGGGGCGSGSAQHACSSCAVKDLLQQRRPQPLTA